MTCCCDFLNASNPYQKYDNSESQAYEAWETTNGRRRVITNFSIALSPITCPIRTVCAVACCIPTYLCCNHDSTDKFWKSVACTPPYEDEVPLECCSILYPFHACPVGIKSMSPYTFWEPTKESPPKFRVRAKADQSSKGGLQFEHYALGPERQAMAQVDENIWKRYQTPPNKIDLSSAPPRKEEHYIKITVEYGSV